MQAKVAAGIIDDGVRQAVENLVGFLESGTAAEGLFAPDVFLDLTLPWWRMQVVGPAAVAAVRTDSHPGPGRVLVSRVDGTERGFVLEFEERWEAGGQSWYSRELLRADLRDGQIAELSVYCTGDWDEQKQEDHLRTVRLLRN